VRGVLRLRYDYPRREQSGQMAATYGFAQRLRKLGTRGGPLFAGGQVRAPVTNITFLDVEAQRHRYCGCDAPTRKLSKYRLRSEGDLPRLRAHVVVVAALAARAARAAASFKTMGATQSIRDGYLTHEQMAQARGVSQRTLRGERQRGEGPPYVRDRRTVLYSIDSYRRWLEASTRQPVRPTPVNGRARRGAKKSQLEPV
jgi:hypothetical protein